MLRRRDTRALSFALATPTEEAQVMQGDERDDELDELDPDLEAKLDRHLDRVLERRANQRKRGEAPKDFAEFLDRVRDEVSSVLEEEFGLERKGERNRGDDPPSRQGGGGRPPKRSNAGGDGRTGFEKFLGIAPTERSA